MTERPTPNDRFYEALSEILSLGLVSVNRFCAEIGHDKRNFYKKMANHSLLIPAGWMEHLVLRYGVSADWLLTGRGWMFGE